MLVRSSLAARYPRRPEHGAEPDTRSFAARGALIPMGSKHANAARWLRSARPSVLGKRCAPRGFSVLFCPPSPTVNRVVDSQEFPHSDTRSDAPFLALLLRDNPQLDRR